MFVAQESLVSTGLLFQSNRLSRAEFSVLSTDAATNFNILSDIYLIALKK